MTTARPTKSVSAPKTSAVATISPHSATAMGHSRDSFSEAPIAGTSPTSRSSISGNEIKLRQRVQRRKAETDRSADHNEQPAAARGENVTEERNDRGGRIGSVDVDIENWATPIQAAKTANSSRPSARIEGSAGELCDRKGVAPVRLRIPVLGDGSSRKGRRRLRAREAQSRPRGERRVAPRRRMTKPRPESLRRERRTGRGTRGRSAFRAHRRNLRLAPRSSPPFRVARVSATPSSQSLRNRRGRSTPWLYSERT